MKVFITGIAGFIGFHTALHYKKKGWDVWGIDNFNDYYDPKLKRKREQLLKEKRIKVLEGDIRSDKWGSYVPEIDLVIHLAAMAGVRYSMDHAQEYIDVNIVGTQNVIRWCEERDIKEVIYASTSCVMHGNPLPWNESEKLGNHLSPYGYTKATNEQQFHTSNLKNTVGLRFFTVYGPWGRPDMALFSFTKNILNGKPITVFNNGNMKRDFTYVEDIVQGIWLVSQNMTKRDIYNIGYGKQVELMHFVQRIQDELGIEADIEFAPAHPADAQETWSDTLKLQKLGYKPTTPIDKGVYEFIRWYRSYYND
jgi:UDP-glucuronate 4-epimerase